MSALAPLRWSLPGRHEALLPVSLAATVAAGFMVFPWHIWTVAVIGACLVAIGVWCPGVLLALVIASVPIQNIGAVAIGAGSVTATRLTIGALFIGWLVNVVRSRSRLRLGAVEWVYLVLVTVLICSIVHVVDVPAWAGEVYRWGVAGVVYVIARDVLQDLQAQRWGILALCTGIIGSSLYGFGQIMLGVGPPSYYVGDQLRIYAAFGAPNPFAAYLELVLPVVFAMVIAGRTTLFGDRWLWCCSFAAMTLGVVALLLTQSRGGVLGFTAALLILALGWNLRPRLPVVIGAVAIVGIVLIIVGGGLRERFSATTRPFDSTVQVTPSAWANLERQAHWVAGLAMLRDHPLTGVGAGQFNLRYREYTPEWRFRVPRGHAHNGYIHMGAQAGVPGFIAMCAFTAILILSATRAVLLCRTAAQRIVRVGVLASVVAFSVHSMVDYLNVLSLGVQLAVIVAFATAENGTIASCSSREKVSDDEYTRTGRATA